MCFSVFPVFYFITIPLLLIPVQRRKHHTGRHDRQKSKTNQECTKHWSKRRKSSSRLGAYPEPGTNESPFCTSSAQRHIHGSPAMALRFYAIVTLLFCVLSYIYIVAEAAIFERTGHRMWQRRHHTDRSLTMSKY